jgi:hypothetical protein
MTAPPPSAPNPATQPSRRLPGWVLGLVPGMVLGWALGVAWSSWNGDGAPHQGVHVLPAPQLPVTEPAAPAPLPMDGAAAAQPGLPAQAIPTLRGAAARPLDAASAAIAAVEFTRLRQSTHPDDRWQAYRWVARCLWLESSLGGFPVGTTNREFVRANTARQAAANRIQSRQEVSVWINLEVGDEAWMVGLEDPFQRQPGKRRLLLFDDDTLQEGFTAEHCAAVGPDAVREHRAWLDAALNAGSAPALVAAVKGDLELGIAPNAAQEEAPLARARRDRLIGLVEAAALRGEPAPLAAVLSAMRFMPKQEWALLNREQVLALLERLVPVYVQSLSLKAAQTKPELLGQAWSVTADVVPSTGPEDEPGKMYRPCKRTWRGVFGNTSMATEPWTGEGCGWLLRGEAKAAYEFKLPR